MNIAEAKIALQHLIQFIGSRGWNGSREGVKFNEYVPPPELGLPEAFSITVPRFSDAEDLPKVVSNLATLVADIYSYPVEQLLPVISEADTVMSVSIKDEQTVDGSIELDRFEGMLQELKELMLDTAAFVAAESALVDQVPVEAFTYVKSCRFLQTSRGSFVTSVQLPTNTVLRSASLFDKGPLLSSTVSERISGVLEFVVEHVLEAEEQLYTEQHFREHSQLINLSVLEDIQHLFFRAGNSTLSFSFLALRNSTIVTPGYLSNERQEALAKYVKFVRQLVTEDLPVAVEGKIVELRSRNPQGDTNYVLILAEYELKPTYFAVTLNNELYGVAVQAHRGSRRVRLVGRARRLKTQIKITELDSFGFS